MVSDPTWPHRLGNEQYRPWGDAGISHVWTGLEVLSGLVDAVHALADAPRPIPHKECGPGIPVVLACSPWFTDPDLAAALERVHCCVVTTKPHQRIAPAMRTLTERGRPVPKLWLRGLDYYARPDHDGDVPVEWIGDLDRVEPGHDVDLGPVRVAGWLKAPRGQQDFPIVHAKVAVLGYHRHLRYDADGYGEYEVFGFEPTAVWWGSANFTRQSRLHAEVATVSKDRSVVREMESFLMSVLRLSEPLSSATAAPTPELVDAVAWEPSSADHEYMRFQAEHAWDDDTE